MNKPQLWTKDFFIGTFTNFFLAMNYYLLIVVITVYAMRTFDSSPSEAGLAASIFVIGVLVARLFCGRWIERVGRKKMLIMGTTLCLAMTLFYFSINNIWYLYIIRFLHGVAFGIAVTAVGTIVTNIIPASRRGEGIGYYMLSITLATAIGPYLGMVIIQHGSFRLIFFACTISAILTFGSAIFLSVPEIILTNEQLDEMKGFKWSNFFEYKAIPISIICAIIYFCYSSVLSFLIPYAKEIHLMDAASFFFIVYAVVILVSRPVTGRLFDSKGENIIMYPAFIIFMIGMIFLSQARHGVTLLAAGALIGFGLGVVQFCGQAIAVEVTPQHRLGLANSTFFIGVDVGIGVGPFVLGLFVPFTGYSGVYMGMAIVTVACAFFYHLLHGGKASQRISSGGNSNLMGES